jgi:hypothetical protein
MPFWLVLMEADFLTPSFVICKSKHHHHQGYPMSAMLSQLHDDVLHQQGLADIEKALICEKIANADQNLSDGTSLLSFF